MASDERAMLDKALRGLRTLKAKVAELEGRNRAPIAIVGMACRFPGAPSAEAYWDLLASGREAVGEVPSSRWDPRPYLGAVGAPGTIATTRGGFLDDVYGFDADFFGLSHREARAMDPQQRLLLETSWHALEDAGHNKGLEGSNTGVFMGVALTDWEKRTMRHPDATAMDMYAGTGSFNSVAAGRISYVLGLRGPNVSLDTACSTSLVTAHLACQSLRTGECDMALAGGVNLLLSPDATVYFSQMGALAPDGRCKAFDARADGYVRAEGVGVLVLRRLDDAVRDGDRILAVIRGSAINQDGRSNGLTAPSGTAQREVLAAALDQAGLTAADVGYVEAHGTGTPLGDPIEFDAIKAVYAKGVDASAPLYIGAAKTNIGHAEAAAGVAGLVKVVQCLRHRAVPANLHLQELNPRLRVAGSRVQFPRELTPWNERLVAGVSSFGMSGTNAHIVLSAAPEPEPAAARTGPAVLTVSAATRSALTAQVAAVSHALDDLHDAAWTLAVGRQPQPWRVAVVADDVADARAKLAEASVSQAASRPSVALWFDRPDAELAALLKGWGVRVTAVSGTGAGRLSAAAAVGLVDAASVAAGTVPARFGRSRAYVVDDRTGAAIKGDDAVRAWLTHDETADVDAALAALQTRPDTLVVRAGALSREALAAELFRVGVATDAAAVHGGGRRVALPGTAFEHLDFVLDDPSEADREVAGVRWTETWVPVSLPERPAVGWRVVGEGPLAERLRGLLPSGESVVLTQGGPDAVAAARAVVAAGGRLAVATDLAADPDGHALWGLGRVVAQEAPDVWAGAVDVREAADGALLAALRDADGRDLRLDGDLFEARLTAEPAVPANWTPGAGAWWITGGLGSLGTQIAGWMVARGVRHLVLTSRRAPSAAVAAQHEAWRAQGVQVDVALGDVTDADVVARIRAGVDDLDGVLHAAGVVDDAALTALTDAQISRVWGPKVLAARHLAEHLGDALLVVLTSASGRLGIPGQAAYASANAAVHGVVERLRARGGRGVAVDFGPWAGGMADDDIQRRLAAVGIGTLSLEAGLDQLGTVLADPTGAPIVLDLDPSLYARRASGTRIVRYLGGEVETAVSPATPASSADLDAAVAETLAQVLGREDAAAIDRTRGFFDLGLDSMTAVAFSRSLEDRLGLPIPPTVAFDHGDIDALVAWLEGRLGPAEVPTDRPSHTDEPIAIVGMACRFPGADDPDAFWELLLSGRDAIGPVPADRWDVDALYDPTPATPGRTYVREAAFLDDVRGFDAGFFGIAPREATSLDPQQRLLLEVGVEALEHAGVPLDTMPRSRTGVFMGIGPSDYGRRFDPMVSGDPYAGTGNEPSFAAGRLAYALGAQGPAVGMNTACSTSLVTTHLACQSLREGGCDLALAGGVHLMLSPETTVQLSQLQALSPRARCRTFDAGADGYARGEGCGIVVLKRLSDAERDGDVVLALVRGSAVNHDGPSAGLTVPSGRAQAKLLREALSRAGVAADEVGFLEAHGTGTKLGDPIEVGAVKEVYGQRPADRPLVMSSVKTHIGHLELAAGVAGLIATVQTLRHGRFAPHLHLDTPNPAMDLDFPVQIPTASTDWAAERRLGAISSFGLSGTNAHLILEGVSRAVEGPSDASEAVDRSAHLLALSARSEGAVRALAGALASRPDVADIAWSLHHTRETAPYRATVAGDADAIRSGLARLAAGGGTVHQAPATRAPLVWMFTGQGAQAPGMGADLYAAHPVFREVIDRCEAALQALRGESLRAVMFGDDRVHQTTWTQPALYALEVGLAALWRSWGVLPDAVIGHSIGEIAAAHVAGVIGLEDGLRMVAERGRRMQALPEGGAMASVGLDASAIGPLVDGVEVAAVNAPGETVISGDADAMAPLLDAWEAEGVRVRRLRVSHAFHSPRMAPMLDDFEAFVAGLPLQPATIPVLSNLTAREERAALTEPAYWRRHVREAVRFADGLRAAPEGAVFLELGPHPVLSGMGARVRPGAVFVPSLKRGEDRWAWLGAAVGALRAHGYDVDLTAWDAPFQRRRVALPTTPWQRREHWVPRVPTEAEAEAVVPGAGMLYRTRWVPTEGRALTGRLGVIACADADAVAEAIGGTVTTSLDGFDHLIDPRALGARAPFDADVVEAALTLAREASVPVHWVVSGLTGAALRGLSRGVAQELPGTFGGVVEATSLAHLADALGAGPLTRATADGVSIARLGHADDAGNVALTGTWWITGGTGALGLHIARWAAARGVQRLVLTARSEPSEAVRAALEALDIPVEVVRGDVSVRADVDRIVSGIADLTGVVHAAGVLADGALRSQSWEAFSSVFPAKVDAAWHLHEATRDRTLSHFVLLSSAAGTLGWTGQANYGTANAFLDGLARQRRAEGLPATSIAYGPWAEGGMADPALQQAMASVGMRALSPATALGLLERALSSDADVLAVDLDWDTWIRRHPAARPMVSELVTAVVETEAPAWTSLDAVGRRRALEGEVRAVVADVLGAPDPDALDASQGLFDAGLDSLMAVSLARALSERTGVAVSDTVAFDHPSIDALVALLDADLGVPEATARRGASSEPIAIVGMGCRFPGGATSPEAFWDLLVDGREAIVPVPRSRWDADAFYDPTPGTPGRAYVREGAFLGDVAGFEPAVFGISPKEAKRMDPQQRLLLEVSWEALESAGIAPDRLGATRTGVYVGIGGHDYERILERAGPPDEDDGYAGTGNDPAFAGGRVSYVLGARGPALSLNTACSSSLVATHLAVQALRDGSVDVALAGGVRLMLSPEETLRLSALKALSPTARCHTFDADADGYVRGEGAGVVVLQRLSDALDAGHPILAVLRGTALNHDGASSGLTVPSGSAQAALLRDAMADAGLEPGDVSALEAHGTGTPLGDPIEMGAVQDVLGTRETPLLLGSVKTNLGHLELAAGVAGLLKAVQSLRHETWPPHRNFQAWNSSIPRDFPHELPLAPKPWTGDDRVVGVSAFGLSGTNAHVLVGAAPSQAPSEPSPRGRHVLTVSAQSEAGLDAATRQLADHLETSDDDLADVAWTLHHGRARKRHRRAVTAATHAEAVAALRDVEAPTGLVRPGAPRPKVAFLFTGQGSQYPGMAKQLYEIWPVFREVIDACDVEIRRLRGVGLKPVLFADAEDRTIHDTGWTQPALYAVEVGLARLWMSWGVVPDLVLGHSIGELAAAHLAGLYSLEDGLRLVEARGRLMSELPRDGTMAAISASEARVREAIAPYGDAVQVATLNGPEATVISGDAEAVRAVAADFEAREVRVRELTVSHAFHSHKMDPMLEALREVAASMTLTVPTLPVLSNLTARPEREALTDPDYWVRHVREAVRFAPAIEAAREQGITWFVEVGPHPVLCGLGARALPDRSLQWLPSLRRGQDDEGMLYTSAARFHVGAADLDWDAFDATARRRSVLLPTTPWQRTRLWVDGGEATAPEGASAPAFRWSWAPVDLGVPDGRTWWVVGDAALAAELGAVAADDLEATPGRPDAVLWVQPPGDDAVVHYLATVQAVLRAHGGEVPIHALTTDAWADAPDPAARAVWGLGRTLALERPGSWGGLLDRVGTAAPGAIAAAIAHPREDQVRLVDGQAEGLRLTPESLPAPAPLTAGAVLVTGGLGALGLAVADRLVQDGAAVVVLNGRSASRPSAQARVDAWRATGARVEVVLGDVATDAARIVAEAGAFGVPLQAIVHAAGVLDDAAIDNLDTARLRAVAAAKVDGARALHAAAPEVRMVLFSSATAWLGAHGQGNYGAANAWLDAFAERRPNTVSLGFGPWSGTGMAADQLATMRAGGIKPLVPAAAVAAMARAWGAEGAVAIADANWDTWRTTYAPRRARAGLDLLVSEEAPVVTKPRATRAARNQMGSAVREAVARTLGLDDPAAVDPHQGLFDLGLDSLMAVALVERLEALSGLELPASVVFDHPTADGLSKHLLGLLGDGDEADAVETAVTARDDEPIAIVGFACRFPGADDADAFWQLLVDGRCAIGEAPRDRWPELDGLYDPMPGTPGRTYTTEGGFVGDIAGFDAGFFGISPREARAMDPQQRLLLEVSWHALEHAGYAPPDLRGRAAGVYVGMGASEYDGRFQRRVEDTIDAYSGTGNDTSFAAGRVAYVLGLHGPALSVNTACSASLVTVDLACRDLRDGVTSLALAGGVNLMVSSDSTVRLAQLRALSPTARCRAFDADADGYVRGEGCGMVVLERLSDARANGHHVYAVVRGSAVNHDGASSALTVPNGTAQTALLRAAWQRAGITGDDLGYLEAHGTGTKLGDPIEARSLAAALGERATPLPVGSVKTNVGHLELAAGVAGLLKTVLALHHGVIPPHLHLRRRNPEIPESLPLRFPSEAEPWSGPRVAGISSFGLSGTNAHLVLAGGEAPHAEAVAGPPDRPVHLLCLGARSAGALDALAAGVAGRLDEGLADVAASANRTRVSGHHRLAVVGADADAVAAALEGRSRDGLVRAEAPPAPPRMAWLFPGQGERMAFPVLEALATHPAARAVLAELDDAVRQLAGVDLLALAGDLPRLSALPEAGAVLVSVEIVLATLWRAWGAEPDEVVGHGVGEVAAAWAAGRLSAGDAVRVAWLRGEAVAAEAPAGRLLAVRADAASVVAALDVLAVDGAAVAAVNDPRTTVVAVPEAGAGALREGLVARGLTAMPVPGGHAFHTPGMAAAASRFRRALLDVAAEDGHTPWRWASDGTLVPAGLEALADALEGPLRFVDAVRAVEAAGVTVLVELAPRPVLLGMARRGLSPRGRAFLPSAMPDRPWEALLEAVGAAWTRGVEVDLQAFDAPWSRRRVALPFTPFERRRYWVDESVAAPVARAMTVAAPQRDLPPEERIREVVARLLGTEPSAVPLDRPLAWQGLDSMMATELHRTLEQVFGTTVPLDEVLTGPSIRQLTELLR